MKSFDLYFDESGNFEEHTILEDGTLRVEAPQKGASQLVGILVPSGYINDPKSDAKSEQILLLAHQKAKLTLEKKCHATSLLKMGKQKEYAILLSEFLNQLELTKMQPVRLCNSARFGFGDKITTYTSMFADFVVRIFEELMHKHGGVQIELNIIAARVRINGHEKNVPPKFINENEYQKRLVEQIAFTAVRRGVAHNRLNWNITGFGFGSGQNDRPLQVCDLLSNASNRNFRNCSTDQKNKLKLLFGNYDFPLNRSDALKEIEQHRRDGSLASALQTIAENWDRPELDQNVRQNIKEHCSSIVNQLARMPIDACNIHLQQLAYWGSQFLVERNLEMSAWTFKWLEKQIAEPLCDQVNGLPRNDVRWFLARLLTDRLSHHNHRGDLINARSTSERLQNLFPILAGQWEHAPLLTKAMTLRAVHQNDCFEFEEAIRIMGAVEGYYGNLSSLMSDALPGVFPERVRSKQRGEALGTELQSEMFAGLFEPVRLENARRLNEMAIDEFVSEDDRVRQYQYRCQIETFAGKLADARSWLAKSLGIEAKTHKNLAITIKALDGYAQGFALLHWTRIGMEAGSRGVKDELNQFIEAFIQNHLLASLWVDQKDPEYPAHSIRRHLAIALAISGRYKECRKINDKLKTLITTDKLALTLIKLSGLLEVAVRLPDDQAETIRNLTILLRTLANESIKFPIFHVLVKDMLNGIMQYESSAFKDPQALLMACNKVGQ